MSQTHELTIKKNLNEFAKNDWEKWQKYFNRKGKENPKINGEKRRR